MKCARKTLFLLFFCFFHFFAFSREFSNVLLIINYNHAHYESIDFIRELYKPFFPFIVFYGPQEHPDIHLCRHNRGYFSYMAIADAMERYPHFDGYLFCHDDCIMNVWNFEKLDTTKIWFPKIMFYQSDIGNPGNIEKGYQAFSNWCWWKTEWGYPAMIKAYNKTPEIYKQVLEQNWEQSNVVVSYSDIMYIPKQYAADFIQLATIYGSYKCFLETALPTIISCLDLKSNWIWLPGHSLYHKNIPDNYLETAYFNHPVKLSNPQNRTFIANLFKKCGK